MELGDEPEVKTAAKLAQTMAYQNKNFLQVGGCLAATGRECLLPDGPSAWPAQEVAWVCGPTCRPQHLNLLPSLTHPPLQAGLIVAGWDKQEGGSVFAIPLGGTLVQVPFTIGGSGSAYIYGLCDKLWRVSEGSGLWKVPLRRCAAVVSVVEVLGQATLAVG